MKRIGLIPAALVASVLAACSSGSSSTGTTPPASTTNTPAASSSAIPTTGSTAGSTGGSTSSPSASPSASATAKSTVSASAERTAAKAALLRSSDFPAGWTAHPADNSSDPKGLDKDLATCLGVPPSALGEKGPGDIEVNSPDFHAPNNGPATVSETIDVGSEQKIAQEMSIVRGPKMIPCIEKVFTPYLKAEFAKDPRTKAARIGKTSAQRLTIGGMNSDDYTAIRMSVPFSIATVNAKVYVDIVFTNENTAAAQVIFENVFNPFDSATEQHITTLAYQRLSGVSA